MKFLHRIFQSKNRTLIEFKMQIWKALFRSPCRPLCRGMILSGLTLIMEFSSLVYPTRKKIYKDNFLFVAQRSPSSKIV